MGYSLVVTAMILAGNPEKRVHYTHFAFPSLKKETSLREDVSRSKRMIFEELDSHWCEKFNCQ